MTVVEIIDPNTPVAFSEMEERAIQKPVSHYNRSYEGDRDGR